MLSSAPAPGTKMIRTTNLLRIVFIDLLLFPVAYGLDSSDVCKAWLVQSIPTDMPHLSRVSGVLNTADVFRWLAGNSSRRLDIMAQYWQFVAKPDDPRSGDYGYSESKMGEFGAQDGLGVYNAIRDSADRNVSVRALTFTGRWCFRGLPMIGSWRLSHPFSIGCIRMALCGGGLIGFVGGPIGSVVFQVQSLYSLLTLARPGTFPWHSVWKARVPSRVAFFAWFAVLDRILTVDNL